MTQAADISQAFLEEQESAAAPVVEALCAVVPAPPAADGEKLEEVSGSHRVLLIRGGAVIAVSTLVAVGGALLIHALLAGLIVAGSFFTWPGAGHAGGTRGLTGTEDGGSPGGYMILGEGPDDNAAPSDLPARPGVAAQEALPALARLPEVPTAQPRETALDTSALPQVDELGSVMILPPAPARPPTVDIAPPPTAAAVPVPTPAVTAVRGGPGTPTRGTGEGDGGGYADEPTFSWVRGDGTGGSGAGGRGRGVGSGRGNGIDRGLSAANREPRLLNPNDVNFQLPLKYELHPPGKGVELSIGVAADGSITDVAVSQSCGVPEVDELVRLYAKAALRYSPAIQDGKAVAARTQWGVFFDMP